MRRTQIMVSSLNIQTELPTKRSKELQLKDAQLLTAKQVQDYLGVSKSTCYRLLGDEIPFVRLSPHGAIRVFKTDFLQYLDSLRNQ